MVVEEFVHINVMKLSDGEKCEQEENEVSSEKSTSLTQLGGMNIPYISSHY